MVIPHGKKLGGELIVIISDNFYNEGYSSYCDLLFDVEYTNKSLTFCFICDVFFFHQIHLDAYYA